MAKTRLNWEPVVRSLVLHLIKHEITPVAVYDGAYTSRINTTDPDAMADQVADAACGVDESSLRCSYAHLGEIHRCSLLLVFGNDPDELVADYSYPAGEWDNGLSDVIEDAITAFSAEWHGIPCPRVQVA